MSDQDASINHETLGQTFRTPAHPAVLQAMGRVLYNFMSLEETLAATLHDAGVSDLSSTRGVMAKAKERRLADLADLYRALPGGYDVAEILDEAVLAFSRVRRSVRNQVMHAHPYTEGTDDEGNYLPGLAYTFPDGKSWKTVARTPVQLLSLAHEVESAADPMNSARAAVMAMPLDALRSRQ